MLLYFSPTAGFEGFALRSAVVRLEASYGCRKVSRILFSISLYEGSRLIVVRLNCESCDLIRDITRTELTIRDPQGLGSYSEVTGGPIISNALLEAWSNQKL